MSTSISGTNNKPSKGGLEGIVAATTALSKVEGTAASAWGSSTIKEKATVEQAIALTARFPVFLAAFHRLRGGLEPLESRPELGHAANYLYLLSGKQPEQQHVKALDAYLVLLADHGMNASTFTARVV